MFMRGFYLGLARMARFSPAEIANSIAVSEVAGNNCPRPIEPPASPMRASLPGHRQERRQRRLQPRTVPGQYWFPPPKRACSSDLRDKAHGTCDDWGQSLVAFAVGNNPPPLTRIAQEAKDL